MLVCDEYYSLLACDKLKFDINLYIVVIFDLIFECKAHNFPFLDYPDDGKQQALM
jgi:hypothetical protein